MTTHVVAPGDTLGKLAQHHYGKASLWPHIFGANRDQIDDSDEIFVGQELRIPTPPAA
jgi:nucleoid-associated protein YgaU